MKRTHNINGMTLIEVIISLAILGIIFAVFLSVFTTSMIWIYQAGDSGVAYSEAISNLEQKISEADDHPDFLNLSFFDNVNSIDISVRGRTLKSIGTEQFQTSEFETFVPVMPRISLTPTYQKEGDINRKILVKGFDTHFNSSTRVSIYDSSSTNQISGSIVPIVISSTDLEFNLPAFLLNNEYIISVTTSIPDNPNEIARTKYFVEQPQYVLLGENNAFVSSDGFNWLERSNVSGWLKDNLNDAIYTQYQGTSSKSIYSDGISYMIIQENSVLASNNNSYWTVNFRSDINDITWANQYLKSYAASDNGILNTSNRKDWVLQYSSIVPLKAITTGTNIDLTQVIAAVGDNGTFVFFDGIHWTQQIISSDVQFKSISISTDGTIVVLGDTVRDGVESSVIWTAQIPVESAQMNWHETYYGERLNEIDYNARISNFIAVGDQGKILTSTIGDEWISNPSIYNGFNDLNSIYSNGSEAIIVGDNGTILKYNDGDGWKLITGNEINENLLHISGR